MLEISDIMATSSVGSEVVVAIAIGLPSLVIALLSLWLAFLTLQYTRTLHHQPRECRTFPRPLWPSARRAPGPGPDPFNPISPTFPTRTWPREAQAAR
jgi:hypothetical protein